MANLKEVKDFLNFLGFCKGHEEESPYDLTENFDGSEEPDVTGYLTEDYITHDVIYELDTDYEGKSQIPELMQQIYDLEKLCTISGRTYFKVTEHKANLNHE